MSFFTTKKPAKFEGSKSKNEFAFRYYDAKKKVMGKTMAEQLRFAMCWWHTTCWPGSDPFGGDTLMRPWHHSNDEMGAARTKADVMFDAMNLTQIDYFAFHDRDIAPEGASLKESNANVTAMANYIEKKMAKSKKKLLWGTANVFSNRRFMAGAATNPDPDVFAYAGAQIKHAMDVTKGLGGANYIMWGGREGYETLLNTKIGHELEAAKRMLALVIEYKHKIGFKGPIMIEPKPQEPTKHQYDYDVATVYSLIASLGAQKDVKVNIEQNHAILAGHTFEHEIALASALGIFGSIDINRGDYQSGWDTDQFIVNVPEITYAMLEILKAGGFTTGGMNFDAKIRRQSLDADDILHAHVGSMDACAKALLNAAAILEEGKLAGMIDERYAGWSSPKNKAMLAGKESLDQIAARVEKSNINPQPKSGRQERLENLINSYC
jgi:xylose isomerase